MSAKSKQYAVVMNVLRRGFMLIVLVVLSSFQPDGRGTSARSYSVKKVVIDAGHGGYDSGCLGSFAKEKDVALAISLKLGNYIEERFPDVQVIYTRKTDMFIELHQRAEVANNAKADLFICIHSNSACYRDKKKKKDVCNEDTYGAETWVMGLHVANANLEVAKRENEVVLLEKDYTAKYDGFDPNSPEANIIFSLYQNTYLDQSLKLASLVQDEMQRIGRESRGVKQAGFLVLYKTSMPSVLVETGFMSNPAEERFLASEKGQTSVAQAIYKAFSVYKTSLESGAFTKGGQQPEKKKEAEKKVLADSGSAEPGKGQPSPPLPPGDSVAKGGDEKPAPLVAAPTDTAVVRYEFSVQVLLSAVKLKPGDERFRGLKDIRAEQADRVYKYTAGRYATFEEAAGQQAKVREAGFKDAFVVAYKNGIRIPVLQARQETGK